MNLVSILMMVVPLFISGFWAVVLMATLVARRRSEAVRSNPLSLILIVVPSLGIAAGIGVEIFYQVAFGGQL
jgi:hypothetical protein